MEASETEQQATATRITHPRSRSKRFITVVLVLLCVLVSWVGTIDDKTEEYVDSATLQALTAYAGARALNAGISLLQSGEIGGNIFIADMSIHPFESLDPVNDMVEDYSTVMKYAIGSLMIQELLIEILSTDIFKWLITVAAFLLIASLLLFNGLYSSPLLKCFFFVTIVRFLFVITIFISGQVDNTFVNKKTVEEMETVSIAAKGVDQFERNTPEMTPAERDKVKEQIDDLETKLDALNVDIDKQVVEVARAKERLDSVGTVFKGTDKDPNIYQLLKGYLEGISQWLNDYLEAKRHFNSQEERLEDLERQFETTKRSIAKLYGGKGLIGKAHDIFSSLQDLSYDRIMQAATDSIESMLKLIALFVFKTLLMPLFFLLLFLRAFKFVWGIDPRGFISESYAEVKGDK
jgi:tetrahydromethanopterin S-methyltransferase subunit G